MQSRTQTSLARLRKPSLHQDATCSAAGDVLVISLNLPDNGDLVMLGTNKLHQMLTLAQSILDADGDNIEVNLISCKWLDDDVTLHAERSCTQVLYHYLVPFRWLPDSDELTFWAIHKGEKGSPPPEALRRLKSALRSMESNFLGNDDISIENHHHGVKRAAGRFGGLASRERRAWHNFADPSLRGQASPSHETVWKSLDRARIIDFLRMGPAADEVVAVVEFRGEAFLQQQVRRMVAVAVSMAQEWLPPHFVREATRCEVFLNDMPLAPEGRLYLADSRFHFEEMRTSGRSLFSSNSGGAVTSRSELKEAMSRVQKRLLEQVIRNTVKDVAWLAHLRDSVSPSLLEQLQSMHVQDSSVRKTDSFTPKAHFAMPPIEYLKVLAMLRAIVTQRSWPVTSAARSTVIREQPHDGNHSRGSFTVVHPGMLDALVQDGISIPLGNNLFPDLVESIFELESALARTTRQRVATNRPTTAESVSNLRAASSHCAVNCNAVFTPHVDSGRGAGQSVSMIVGLGNYVCGELVVEGKKYDIRYTPLEFDGWKLRHWTQPFQGERFSLVWFTPERK